MFRTTENGLLLTMPPSRNDMISGSTPARICSLKLAAINFCRSGQSNPRFASNLSRFESWTGGNAPGKLDVARAASARPGTSARPEVSPSSDQLRYLKVQNSPCSRSAITDGVLIFTSRGYPKKSVIETARSSSWPGGRRDDGLSPWPRIALSPFALGVACHFQTSQQVDIARETADCRLDRAGLPVRTGILRPRLLELPKCGSFVARAAGHIDARSTLKTALPHGVKLRHRVRDGNRRKGRQDCDRQMKQRVDLLASCFWKGLSARHLSGTPTVGLGGRTGAQQAQLYLAAIDERDWRIEDHTLASSQSGVYFHPRA